MFRARYFRLLPPTALGVLLCLASSPTAAAQASPAAPPSPPPRDEQARPLVKGRHGAVVSLHPLASSVGLRVLMQGGNAFDAAVATALAATVVDGCV